MTKIDVENPLMNGPLEVVNERVEKTHIHYTLRYSSELKKRSVAI